MPRVSAEQRDARARCVGGLAHAGVEHLAVERVVERVDDRAEYWRATALSVSSFWSRTPASRPEVTPRYTPAITTSVMAKNSSARRLAIERSFGSR